jgi:hypothetical protein
MATRIAQRPEESFVRSLVRINRGAVGKTAFIPEKRRRRGKETIT